MEDSLLNLSGLPPKKLKRKRGKYQHGKSFVKFFKGGKNTKPELEVQNILRELKITFTTQLQVESKFYDIYIPKYNLLIEVDGVYWHGQDVEWGDKSKMQKKSFYNDIYKDGLATKFGYKLIRIREDEIDKKRVKKLIQDAIK